MKNKIKHMRFGPEITDEQIKSYMDFNLLLTKHTLASIRRKQKLILKSIGLGLTLAVVVSIWFLGRVDLQDNKIKQNPLKQVIIPGTPSVSPVQPDSTHRENNNSQSEVQRKEKRSALKLKPALKETGTNEDTTAKEIAAQENQPAYVQAEPVEGYPALYEYFSRELTYPMEVIADSVKGVVNVLFTINTEGKPEAISIEQSLGPAFDKEAIRLIKNMPPWKPATYNRQPVKSRMSLPLTFQIKKIKTRE